jgi:hypothetical protein
MEAEEENKRASKEHGEQMHNTKENREEDVHSNIPNSPKQ